MDQLPPKLCFTNSSFGLVTIKERWPVILAGIIDSLHRNRDVYQSDYKEDIKEKLKKLTGLISRLRYEITTNKPLTLLSYCPNSSVELDTWNKFLRDENIVIKSYDDDKVNEDKTNPRWFDLSWLLTECYLHRRIIDHVYESHLENFDPFALIKHRSFAASDSLILSLLSHLDKSHEVQNLFESFQTYLQASLWANESDLSLHFGEDFHLSSDTDLTIYVQRLKEKIVINEVNEIWKIWSLFCERRDKGNHKKIRVALVLDNAGPEFVADLCLGEFLLKHKMADTITYYVKSIPWFVSDVTKADLQWLFEDLCLSVVKDEELICLLKVWTCVWRKHLSDGTFTVKESYFWSLPCPYDQMANVDPSLYKEISEEYDVVIFKGDYNYRKLLGDRCWRPDCFKHKIRAFSGVQFRPIENISPSPCICVDFGAPCTCNSVQPPLVIALRVCKCDLAVGLTPECLHKLVKKDENWWIIGKYGFVQVVGPLVMDCRRLFSL